MNTFADRLNQRLKLLADKGLILTDKVLATKCDSDENTLAQWKKGESTHLTYGQGFRLAGALGVSAYWLATGEGEPERQIHGEILQKRALVQQQSQLLTAAYEARKDALWLSDEVMAKALNCSVGGFQGMLDGRNSVSFEQIEIFEQLLNVEPEDLHTFLPPDEALKKRLTTPPDLFQMQHLLPQDLQDLLASHARDEMDYVELGNFQDEVALHGYTFEFGLDAELQNLRPMTPSEIRERDRAFIHPGAQVLWIDPDEHVGTGVYTVAEVPGDDAINTDPHARVCLKSLTGHEGPEVYADELKDPSTCAFEWAFAPDSMAFEPDQDTPNQRNIEIAQVIQYAADDIDNHGICKSLGERVMRDSNGMTVGTFSIVSINAPSPREDQVVIRIPVRSAMTLTGELAGAPINDALTNVSRDIIKSPTLCPTGLRPGGLQFSMPAAVKTEAELHQNTGLGQRYNHVFELAFTVFDSDSPSADDVTPAGMRAAIERRLNDLSNAEILEAIGLPIESDPVNAPTDNDLAP